jgi:uncharacterized protein (TIGR03435 family)
MNRLLVGVTGIVGIAALTALILSGAPIRAQRTVSTVPEWQKIAGSQQSFEVASIKLADPNKFTPPNFALNSFDTFPPDPNPHGRLIAQFPLEIYIQFAYKLPAYPRRQRDAMLAHAPKWVSTDWYAVNSEAEGNPTKDQMRLMLQSLLADRFKLAVHFEHQETRTLALVLDKPGKTGAKLYPHSNGPPCDLPSDVFACNSIGGIFKPSNVIAFGGRDLTMAQIAAALSGPLGLTLELPLVDQTGLGGRFDFSVEFTRDPTAPDDPTAYLEALQDQLGLKLKATTALLDTLVIDHVERPTEN